MGVKKRKLRRYVTTNVEETRKRLYKLQNLRIQIETIMKRGDLIYFVDEATFSPKSSTTEVW